MKWIKVKIGDLCKVGRGSSPRPKDDMRYFEGGNIPWIKIADASKSGKVIYETEEYVNGYGASFSRLLKEGSLILATSGVSLGQVKFLGFDGCIHDGWLYLDEFNGVDKEFLYYRLLLLERYFHSKSYGAAIQNINTEILRNTEINLPPLPTQRRIASILSAYDDLIENNLRRIKLLEEAAQHIYREWFVRMRFPGWEEVRFGEDGLPEGWRRVPLGQVAPIVTRGVSPKYVEQNGIVVINQKCIRNQTLTYDDSRLTSESTKIPDEKMLQQYDVLVNSTGLGTLGRVAQVLSVGFKQTVDTHVTIVRADDKILSAILLGFELKHNEPLISKLGKGSTNQTELSRSDLKEIVVITVPPADIQNRFEELTKPVLAQINALQKQIEPLKEARDILLPRLMNQTIEV